MMGRLDNSLSSDRADRFVYTAHYAAMHDRFGRHLADVSPCSLSQWVLQSQAT